MLAIVHISTSGFRPLITGPMAKIPGTLENMLAVFVHGRTATTPVGVTNPMANLPELPAPADFTYIDWNLDEMAPSTGIVAVPSPGVVIASFGLKPDEAGFFEQIVRIKFHLQQDPSVLSFLASPESRFIPQRFSTYDFFISYSSDDADLANELHSELLRRGATVFLAEKSIQVGAHWESELVSALRQCKVVVLLLTPNSRSSDWVIFEAGAAWGLEIPLAIARSYVSQTEMPAALGSRQAMPFETSLQRNDFVQSACALASLGET